MDNIVFKQVGNSIQKVLTAQGRTQQYLADRLGISKQVMNKIISGSKAINVAEISKIANVLGVSADSLLATNIEYEQKRVFAFMGQVENTQTKEKLEFLKTVINEILMLEEHANA